MAKRQAGNGDVLDVFAILRTPFENEELLGHRGDDVRGLHVLVRSGLVVKPSVASEEPFTRCIQSGLEILQMETAVLAPRIPGLHAPTGGDDHARVAVDGIKETRRVVPLVVDVHLDVVQLPVAEFAQRGQHLRAHRHRLPGPGRPLVVACKGLLLDIEHVVVELIGRSCACRASSVDEELFEVPLAGCGLRNVRFPETVSRGCETGDGAPAAEDRSGPGCGFIRYTTVSGREYEGLGQHVAAVGDNDADRCRDPGDQPQPSYAVPSPGQRGHRSIRLCVVGSGSSAGPGVVAVCRDIDRRGACAAWHRCQGNHGGRKHHPYQIHLSHGVTSCCLTSSGKIQSRTC